jgi:hypothetical protein
VGFGKLGQDLQPKVAGGLGLRDHESLSAILGEKTWWQWLQSKDDLWGKLWKRNYAPQTETQNLIRMDGNIPGSCIWNTAWSNKDINQQHYFWEVRNGKNFILG